MPPAKDNVTFWFATPVILNTAYGDASLTVTLLTVTFDAVAA